MQWIAVDDRVRGGSSQSTLAISGSQAIFSGKLDTKTLGGAGFASQATTPDSSWNLSAYDGIEVSIDNGDEKVYTLILKDEERNERRDDGREQSSLSWEYDFRVPSAGPAKLREEMRLFIPWNEFKPTYRGREKKDAGSLKTGNVTRFSIMMRSFFDTQEGDFRVVLKSIAAVQSSDEETSDEGEPSIEVKKRMGAMEKDRNPVSKGWMSWITDRCMVS